MLVRTRRFAFLNTAAALLAGPARKATIASLQAQVEIVERVAITPEIKAFFHTVSVLLDRRTAVREKLPDVYGWMVGEFGLHDA